jgi:hypothetical protein
MHRTGSVPGLCVAVEKTRQSIITSSIDPINGPNILSINVFPAPAVIICVVKIENLKTKNLMKKIILGLLSATLIGTAAQTASADVIVQPSVVYQAPVAVQTAPIPAPPLVYTQAPVIVATAPVVVIRPPLFPLVFGFGYHHRDHGRW